VQRTDGTESVAKLVEDVAHEVKVVVDGALAWTEEKADKLSSEQDSARPYTSPATCAPSDFNPIAGGVLATITVEVSNEEGAERRNNGGCKDD